MSKLRLPNENKEMCKNDFFIIVKQVMLQTDVLQ